MLALEPASYYFAREARAYAPMDLADGALLLAVAQIAGRDAATHTRGLVLYGASAIGTIYLHATSLLFVAVAAGATTLYLVWLGRRSTKALTGWIVANLVVALAAVPELVAAAHLVHSPDINWIRFGPWSFIQLANQLLLGNGLIEYRSVTVVLAAVMVAAIALWLVRRPPSRDTILIAVVIPALWLVLVGTISVSRPILLPRVAAWLLLPFCLLSASVLLDRRGRYLRIVLAVALGVSWAIGVSALGTQEERWPWRDMANDLASLMHKSDTLVFISPAVGMLPVEYYRPGLEAGRNMMVVANSGNSGTAEHVIANILTGTKEISPDDAVTFLDRHDHPVWIVTTQGNATFAAVAARARPRADVVRELGGLVLIRY